MIINRSDCILNYQFEGNVNNLISGGSAGTVTGTATYIDSTSGKAFDFDGSTYIDSGVTWGSSTGSGAFTILMRGDITAEDASVRRYISNLPTTNGMFYLYNGSSNAYILRVNGASGNIDVSIADTNFTTDIYALMLYFDPSTEVGVKAYDANGTLQTFTTSTTDATWNPGTTNIFVGAKSDGTQQFDGALDDIVVIDGALLTDEDFYRYYMGLGITDK